MQNEQLPPKALPASAEMGLFAHLAELRQRLIYSIIAIVVGAIVAYNFSTPVFALLSAPYYSAFPHGILIGTGPAEAFMIRLKVAVFVGALLVSPVLFAQVWLFVAPGMYDHERKLFLPFIFITTALFLFGVWLCYAQVLPLAYRFFSAEYQATGLTPNIKISEHLSTMITALLGFGIVFEMPVLAYLLGRLGVIDHRSLLKAGRYAIVLIFIVAAILTPPDVLSQFLMAAPLLVLYGVSILVVKYTAKARPH
jgi:sec-independent protein translocase protein TatC